MYLNKKVCAVVPSHNEGTQIGKVILTMPDFVDYIVIVDDKSKDNTVKVVEEFMSQTKKLFYLNMKRIRELAELLRQVINGQGITKST